MAADGYRLVKDDPMSRSRAVFRGETFVGHMNASEAWAFLKKIRD